MLPTHVVCCDIARNTSAEGHPSFIRRFSNRKFDGATMSEDLIVQHKDAAIYNAFIGTLFDVIGAVLVES